MNLRRFIFAGLCCLTVAACGKITPGGSGFNEACVRNSDCAKPFYCKDGLCVLDAATVCQAGKTRCNGDTVETCSAGGDSWTVAKPEDNCATSCLDGACTATQCNPNERSCVGSMIYQCLSNGSAKVFVESCAGGCDPQTADCAAPLCSPFDTRCKDGETSTLQTCDSLGTAWVDSSCGDPASTVCVAGRCLPKVCSVSTDATGAVTSRDERCNGTVAEQCNDSQSGWDTMQVCTNGCDFDQTTGVASCPAAACAPFETKCKDDRITLETCNSRGTAFVDGSCDAATQVCHNGACVPKVCADTYDATTGQVATRQERCNGNVHEQCNDTETGYDAVEVCQYGCTTDGAQASCAPATCATGETACDGLALDKCAPDQGSFGFVQYCPSGCSGSKVTDPSPTADPTNPARAASCAQPFCAPLSRVCGTDTATGQSYVNVCKADGTAYDRMENCPGTCTAGECVVTNNTCNPGDIRCTGYEVEECVRLSTGATEWRFSERCLGECLNGACNGTAGSAGCLGGANATAVCGSASRPVVPLHPMLADPVNDQIACDGISRVLVYSDPITSAAGVPVPDGTMVTFADSTGSLLASADADPLTPGLQRPTMNGIATVLVLAPNDPTGAGACATATATAPFKVTVTGSVGGRATGTTTLNFANPVQTGSFPTKAIYVGEDFSTTRLLDRTTTTAQWDTNLGASVALPAFSLGTGADGDLCVGTLSNGTCNDTAATIDLAAAGYARSYNVQSLGTSDASVDNVLPSLAPGDEVLLYSMWTSNGAGTVGNYEFKTVASVATGKVLFTTPIQNSYGNAGVFDSTQRTILQRVPQFKNVTIPAGGTLTSAAPTNASGYPAGGSGILAFRANGTVQVLGMIDMEGQGMPVGLSRYPAATTTPSLTRLLEGESNGGNNGGIVYLTAKLLSFQDDSGNPAMSSAVIQADNKVGGQGGTVWAAGGDFTLTTSATRFLASSGHVRLDYGETDNPPGGSTPAASPIAYVGENGAYLTQSRVAYDEQLATSASSTFKINDALLIGVLGGDGATQVLTPMPVGGIGTVLPDFQFSASADGGATWGQPSGDASALGDIPFAGSPAASGQQFIFQISSTTLDDKPAYMRGLEFKVALVNLTP